MSSLMPLVIAITILGVASYTDEVADNLQLFFILGCRTSNLFNMNLIVNKLCECAMTSD